MRRIRAAVVAGVLTGLVLGCSKKDGASMPANAPRVEDEKALSPRTIGGDGGPKQRPGGGGASMNNKQ
jgi:hypothetical protein